MEVIKLNRCRLCAQCKSPHELIGQIHNEKLAIESKLIVCCQWNVINVVDENHSDQMPQDVCVSCLQSLQNSWDFAEQVKHAQIELKSKLTDPHEFNFKPEPAFEFECCDEVDDDTLSNGDAEPNFVDLKVEEYSPMGSVADHNDDFDDFDDDKNEKAQAKVGVSSIDTEEPPEPNALNEPEEKKLQTLKLDAENFLEAIGKEDRNADGTIKLEAVQRLELDNWTILQYVCYLCKTLVPDHYEWRKHIKVEHPALPYRHLCNVCNAIHYSDRKPLYRHVINKHRGYLKFW